MNNSIDLQSNDSEIEDLLLFNNYLFLGLKQNLELGYTFEEQW
jgi:hypothetical protein